MLEFQKLIDEVAQFQAEYFLESTTISKLHHLSEEVPELIEELNNGGTTDKIDMEFADCFLLLLGAADKHGLTANSIASIVRRKLEINRKRKWGKPDENGVVKHIKPEVNVSGN